MAGKENDDTLKGLSELFQAAMAFKGGLPRKERKPIAPAHDGQGNVAMKDAAQSGIPKEYKQADIKAKEGTPEWHEEVYQSLKSGLLAPEVKVTPTSASTAKAELSIPETKAKIDFLLEAGAPLPDSEIVLQVYADIARSNYIDDPKFLIAKEAQLLSSINSSMTQAEQVKIITATAALDKQIYKLSAGEAEYINMTVKLHSESLERQAAEANAEKEDKNQFEEKEYTEEEQQVINGAKQTIQEKLIEAAGNNTVLAAKVATLNIPDEAAAIIGNYLHEGKSLHEAVKAYADAVRPYLDRGMVDNHNIRRGLFLNSMGDILGDQSLSMRKIQGASVSIPKVYDSTWTFPDPKVESYLKGLQEQLNDLYFVRDSPRKIEEALEKIKNFDKKDLPTGTNADKIVEQMLDHHANLLQNMRGRGEGITEQFSDMFMDATKRKLTVLYPKWTISQMYRRFNDMITYNTRGQISEQFMRDIGQVGSYYANDMFLEDIRQLFTEPQYLKEIELATGQTLADVGGDITKHQFYIDRVGACNAAKKEAADLMSAKENLTYAYGVIKSGEEAKVHKGVLGELGDSGIYLIKGSNDYLSGVAYDLFDTLGSDLKYNWVKGGKQRISDTEMKLLFNGVVDVMLQNKGILERRFEEYWKAQSSIMPGKDFSGLERQLGLTVETKMNFGKDNEQVIGMVKEAQKLYTATLREVYMREGSLSPGESNAQRGQGPKYGGEEGIFAYLKGRKPIEFFIERWDLPTAAGRLHLHVMCDQYARMMEVDKAIEPMLERAMNDAGYKRQLGEYALGVVEKVRDKSALQAFFEFDLNGNKINNPPASIDSLTKEQLKQLLLYKEGMKYADLVLGSYDYEGASWVAEAKTTVLDLIYGKDSWKNGIGTGSIKRQLGGALIGAESHHARKAAEDMLIYGKELHHGHHGDVNVDRGVLKVEADFKPQRGFQDLMEHNHYGMRSEFRSMVNEGMFTGLAKEKHVVGDGEEFWKDGREFIWKDVIITAETPEFAYRPLKSVWRMADEFISYGQNLKTGERMDTLPINYAIGPTPDQDAVLSVICENMQVDKAKYLAIMKRLSNYVGQSEQLHEMVKPQYLDTYTSIQDLDSREKFLDTADKVQGTKYKKETLAIASNLITKASGLQGGQEGKSKMCGIARVSGDDLGASENANHLAAMLGELSQKKLMETLPAFGNGILMVYGNTFKHRGVGVMAGSWAKCARMDPVYDITMAGSLNSMLKSSPFRRVTGLTGDHGAPTLTLNEEHQFWTQMQIDAGVNMVDAEHVNHFMEHELGLVWKFGETYTTLPWYLYTYSLAGLLASMALTAKGVEESSEGFSAGMGGSSGGPSHGSSHGGH